MKIAISGKGGVGKTTIAGALAMWFARTGMKTIAIDADPSPNLALTLGLSSEQARKILPISENKQLIESKTDTGYSGIYRLHFTVDDIVSDFAVKTPFDVNLIVMGTVHSMGSGCTCAANAVIRAVLRHLVVERNEAIVLDMEAGVEHIGRGTARNVDAMLIVADANLKSLETAKHIYELAAKAGMKKIFLVGNRIEDEQQKKAIEAFGNENKMAILGFVPFDKKIVEAEMRGETPLKQIKSEAILALGKIGEKLASKEL
jgi:CO dehydrogenase maturation factor